MINARQFLGQEDRMMQVVVQDQRAQADPGRSVSDGH
jgi:hypothetical protein